MKGFCSITDVVSGKVNIFEMKKLIDNYGAFKKVKEKYDV